MHFRPRLLCEVVFICVWKRRYADVRAGTQAPPLRFRLGWIAHGRLMPFWGLRIGGWFRLGGLRGWGCLFVGKTVYMNQHHRCCTFDSAGLIERSEIYPG